MQGVAVDTCDPIMPATVSNKPNSWTEADNQNFVLVQFTPFPCPMHFADQVRSVTYIHCLKKRKKIYDPLISVSRAKRIHTV